MSQPRFWIEGFFIKPSTFEPCAIVWTNEKIDFRNKLDFNKFMIWPEYDWEQFECDSHGGPYTLRTYVRFHPDANIHDIARAFDSLLYRTSIFDKIRSLF